MIWYFTPYSIQKDFGKAYNEYANLVTNPEDWICFVDGDSQFLTSNFGHQIEEYVSVYPDTGIFTCYTNRVGNLEQCYNNRINEDSNILNHKRIALQLQKEKRLHVKELTKPISGMLMVIRKSVWDKINGSPEEKGILGIDNHISQRVLNEGLKIRLMEAVYLFHFYRLDTGVHNKGHLIVDESNRVYNPAYRQHQRQKLL